VGPLRLSERPTACVEAWLHNEFISKEKKPHLGHPLYFVLGEMMISFARMVSSVTKTPEKLQHLLSCSLATWSLPILTVWPALTSSALLHWTLMSLDPETMVEFHIRRNWWDEKVWRFSSQASTWSSVHAGRIEDVVGKRLPGMKWKEDPKWRIDRYIEVQVWDAHLGVPARKDIWFRENKIALLLTRCFKELSSKLY